jgi:hypothetical protein
MCFEEITAAPPYFRIAMQAGVPGSAVAAGIYFTLSTTAV